MTRRAEGPVFKGDLKALAKDPSHLGQAFRPRAHEAGILAQNYLLAHLLKGGLYTSGTRAQDHTQHIQITDICNNCIQGEKNTHAEAMPVLGSRKNSSANDF